MELKVNMNTFSEAILKLSDRQVQIEYVRKKLDLKESERQIKPVLKISMPAQLQAALFEETKVIGELQDAQRHFDKFRKLLATVEAEQQRLAQAGEKAEMQVEELRSEKGYQ